MPHATLRLRGGLNVTRTYALNEAGISDCNLIRFVPDIDGGIITQKLGGYTRFFPSNVGSTVRALWAWQDTNSIRHLALGAQSRTALTTGASGTGTTATITYSGSTTFSVGETITVSGVTPTGYNGTYVVTASTANSVSFASAQTGAQTVAGVVSAGDALSVITDGSRQILTPRTITQNVTVDVDTTTGSPIAEITAAGSQITAYDTVYIKTQISVGGLVLFGLYPAIYVDGTNKFQVVARDVLGNPVNATSSITAGGAVPEFAFTVGDAVVSVTLADHGYIAGDTFPILVPLSAGSVTLYGNYTVLEVTSSSVFKIRTGAAPATANVTNASGTGATATITFSGTQVFAVGDTVRVASVNPAGYNGDFTVTAAASTTVSFASAETGAFVSGGTVFNLDAFLNGGLADYEYYKVPGPLPTGTGYGVGGYGVGGYGVGGAPVAGTTANPISAVDWTLDNWGEVLLSCPVGGAIYAWSPSSGQTQAAVISGAPPVNDGMFVAMPQRQVVAWGSTSNGIQDQLLIRWSDVNDYGAWIPLVANQAGSYRIPKGSRIVGCIQGPQQGLVWTDLSIWAMQYVGPPFVYQFNEIGTGCGLIARKAATSLNGVVYWMGQSQFYRLAGNGVEPLPCPVWDVIFQDLDRDSIDKIRIAANSRFSEIGWFYPTKSSNGEISRYVKYNTTLNAWDFGSLVRTAWINESVLGPPIGAGSPSTDDGERLIYQHETSTDADGEAMHSSFKTGYFVISDGEMKIFVDQVWPDMKWGYYDGSQNATLSLTFNVTDYPTSADRVYGPFTINSTKNYLTPRFRGRLVSIEMESHDIGSFWRLGAVRYRAAMDGKF